MWRFFEDVWKYILGSNEVLQLSDIVYISRDKKLYLANIENVKIRNFFITNYRKLKVWFNKIHEEFLRVWAGLQQAVDM